MARILVIDDEKPICTLCASALRVAGYKVLTANDGFEGVNLFRANPTDAVLVDLLMPHSGLQVIRVLRETFPDLPIIAMSGYGRRRLEMASGVGANRILSKPFAPDELVALVDDVLDTGEKPKKPAPGTGH